MSTSNFPITEAQLVALFMQGVAYGIHTVTFFMCLWTLLRRSTSSSKPINWPWLSVAVVLFAIGTIDVAFNLYHNLVAFIFNTGPGGAAETFNNISNWVNVMRTLWILIQAAVSDAALIYRCFAIYGRKWQVIILPAILLIGATTCGIMDMYFTATLDSQSSIPDSKSLIPLISAYCTLTLATNLISTGFIALRIWKVNRKSSRFFVQDSCSTARISLADVNKILIESALLYTTTILATFILDLTGSNASYGVSDVGLELAGISFDLIIIRIGKGVAIGQVQPTEDVPSPSSPITLRAIKSRTTENHSEDLRTHLDKELEVTGTCSDIEGSSFMKGCFINPSSGAEIY